MKQRELMEHVEQEPKPIKSFKKGNKVKAKSRFASGVGIIEHVTGEGEWAEYMITLQGENEPRIFYEKNLELIPLFDVGDVVNVEDDPNRVYVVNESILVGDEKNEEKVKQTQVYLEDLKNEIENQLKVSYIEVDTKEMEQLEAIFSRIYALKAYANRFYQFYNTLKELLGIDITGTEKDLYQAIAKLKDKVTEYDRYLEQVKGLIWQDGENESGSLETGEQTKEELDKVYIRTEEIVNQLEILKEIFQIGKFPHLLQVD